MIGKFQNWLGKNGSSMTEHDSALPLHVEALELRRMLAGDVTVNVTVAANDYATHHLQLLGDGDANHVVVESFSPSAIHLKGLDNTNLVWNNQSYNELFFDVDSLGGSPALAGLMVKLRGGNDRLEISDVAMGSKLQAILGSGNDSFSVDGGLRNGARLVGGSGDDSFDLANSQNYHDVTVIGGGGVDSLIIRDFDFAESADLVAKMGGGDDDVALERTKFFGGGHATVITNAGADKVVWDDVDVQRHETQIRTGGHEDEVIIKNSTLDQDMFVHLGGGADEISLSGLTQAMDKELSIHGGSGDDLADVTFLTNLHVGPSFTSVEDIDIGLQT